MNLDALKSFKIADTHQDYTAKDVVLYALGLGYGSDPLDPKQLAYVWEDGLKVVPSFCNVLAHPNLWISRPELGIDWVKVLHAEQAFEVHRPLPPAGSVRASFDVLGVQDKGADKGATLALRKTLVDAATGEACCSVVQTIFMRGDGGQGGFGTTPAPPTPVPDGPPADTLDIATLPQAALIYRLSGDYNPLHASPAVARQAGFERPILHGLCTLGVATRALLTMVAADEPERLRAVSVRFSRPVFPGETIRTELYGRDAEGAFRFRCRAVERDLVVLDRGVARLA